MKKNKKKSQFACDFFAYFYNAALIFSAIELLTMFA